MPYIKKFHSKIIVIKYGGSLMYNDNLKKLFAQDIALLKWVGMHPVIVHGKEISSWLTKLGKETKFIDGLRYTDSETMEITEIIL